MTKICFKCKKDLPISEFYKHKFMKDGHLNKCKLCTNKDVQENYQVNKSHYKEYEIQRQRNNFTRIFNHRYSCMLARVEGRATRNYGVEGKEICSKEEFLKWCNENIKTFKFIHSKWAESNYQNKLAPSIDRKKGRMPDIG